MRGISVDREEDKDKTIKELEEKVTSLRNRLAKVEKKSSEEEDDQFPLCILTSMRAHQVDSFLCDEKQ